MNYPNPNLERLLSIISSGMRPSHGYTIAEKAPEMVTAPGVYFPAEKGQVVPLQSRESGGEVSPSREADTEKEKLGILKDILSQVRTNPNHAMESRQFGGPVSPDGEVSSLDDMEKAKYDIFKAAITALKPQKQGPVANVGGEAPVNSNYRAGGGINAPLLSSEKAAAANQEDAGLRKIFSMFNTPSLPGLPKPITTESYGVTSQPTKDLTELIPRQAGGSVTPIDEVDEEERLRRIMELNKSTPESLELAARRRWETPGYAESRPNVTPGYQTSYYEVHPEERLMDYIAEKNKPTEDLYRQLIQEERQRAQGFGRGPWDMMTYQQKRFGKQDEPHWGAGIPALMEGLRRTTTGEMPGSLRGTRETTRITAPHLVQNDKGEYVWATPGGVMPAGVTGRTPTSTLTGYEEWKKTPGNENKTYTDYKTWESSLGKTETVPSSLKEFETATGMSPTKRGTPEYSKGYTDFLGGRSEATRDPTRLKTLSTNLRKEFNTLQPVKDYKNLDTKIRSMEAAYAMSKKSGNFVAIDQAMISLFNKMTDPQSVVRESEYARTPKNLSVINNVLGKMNKWLKGGAGITQEERDALMAVAREMHTAGKKGFEEVRREYRQYATDYGLDPESVISLGTQEKKGAPEEESDMDKFWKQE